MTNKESDTGSRPWKFVNAFLNKTQKEKIRKMEATIEEFDNAIRQFAAANYKVSLSFDLPNDTFVIAISGKKGCADPDVNKCITFRHRDWAVVRSLLCYAFQQGNENDSLSRSFDATAHYDW